MFRFTIRDVLRQSAFNFGGQKMQQLLLRLKE
jgi:hypothetical protein